MLVVLVHSTRPHVARCCFRSMRLCNVEICGMCGVCFVACAGDVGKEALYEFPNCRRKREPGVGRDNWMG